MKLGIVLAAVVAIVSGGALAGQFDGTYAGWVKQAAPYEPFYRSITVVTKGREATLTSERGQVVTGRVDGNQITFGSLPGAPRPLTHTLLIKGNTALYKNVNAGSGHVAEGVLERVN